MSKCLGEERGRYSDIDCGGFFCAMCWGRRRAVRVVFRWLFLIIGEFLLDDVGVMYSGSV